MIGHALLRQSVTVAPLQGESATGPLFGEPVAYPARIESARRRVQTSAGPVVVSEAVAYLRPDVPVSVGDRVSFFGRSLRVLSVTPAAGAARTEYLEATLGRSES